VSIINIKKKDFSCAKCLGLTFPPLPKIEKKSYRIGTSDEIDRTKRVAPGATISEKNAVEEPRTRLGSLSKNTVEERLKSTEIVEEKKDKEKKAKKGK